MSATRCFTKAVCLKRTGIDVCWGCWDVCGKDAYEGLAADETVGPENMTYKLDPKMREPQVDAPSVPEKRNPREIAECDGCKSCFTNVS